MLILSGVVHLFSNAAESASLADQFSAIWGLRDQITFGSGGVIGVIFGGIPKLLFGKLAAAIVLIVLLVVVDLLEMIDLNVHFYIFLFALVDFVVSF